MESIEQKIKTQTKEVDRGEMKRLIDELPENTEFSLKVTGTSMSPFLLDRRSMVWLIKDTAYKPHLGDVVFFIRLDGSFVLHRVYKIPGNGLLVINGDAQTWTEMIMPGQVVARLSRYRRKENGRIHSVQSFGYRIWKTVWRPIRPFHTVGARMYYYWHRVPYKLGFKKD